MDPEVFFFIELYKACKAFGHLPEEGGVLDQDSFLMYGLMGVAKAEAEYQAMHQHQVNQQYEEQLARMKGSR